MTSTRRWMICASGATSTKIALEFEAAGPIAKKHSQIAQTAIHNYSLTFIRIGNNIS